MHTGLPLILLSFQYISLTYQFKVCPLPKYEEECKLLRENTDFQCSQISGNNIDCILQVANLKSDLAIVSPEEALVANKFLKNLVVLGELKPENAMQDKAAYETVVIVKNHFNGSFQEFKGKKYCHPGFHLQQTTNFMLKRPESVILNRSGVDICKQPGNTFVEKELSALSAFFGPSCRPGPWIDVESQDQVFYKNYSSLCDLCEDKVCNIVSEAYKYPFQGSFDCFLKGGDVALTTKSVVQTYLRDHPQTFHFLCPNLSISLHDYCVWSREPWDLVISNSKNAETVKRQLELILKDSAVPLKFQEKSHELLWNIIFEHYGTLKLNFIPTIMNLNYYLKDFNNSVPDNTEIESCRYNFKWCTKSLAENEKCEWFSQAALNRGINPVIGCHLKKSKYECIDDMQNEIADITTIDINSAYIARRKKLATAAFLESTDNFIATLLVVKDSAITTMKSVQDLPGKSGCFPRFGGIEMLSFLNVIREHNLLPKKCTSREALADFIGNSCLPGAHDEEFELSADTLSLQEKLCSLCLPTVTSKTAQTCNADSDNEFYGNEGALKCLEKAGDFAVITKKDSYEIHENNYRVMCRNGSLALHTGLHVDEECFLTKTVDSEIVFNNKHKDEIILALIQYERWFGQNKNKAFKLFSSFNGTQNLLFANHTSGFELPPFEDKYLKSYVELTSSIDQCVQEVTGESTLYTVSLVLLTAHPRVFKYVSSIIITLITMILLVVLTTVSLVLGNRTEEAFICTNGNEIALEKLCDGKQDCEDASDETANLCYHIICPQDMFRCYYGACIRSKLICNGKHDCIDGSDETRCGSKTGSCDQAHFQCSKNQCIENRKVCDGNIDCSNGLDERATICGSFSCPANSYRCHHGGCIHLKGKCNGITDCPDGSDESKELCKGKKLTCPAVISPRLTLKCKNRDQKPIDCQKPLPVGSTVTYECKEYYVAIGDNNSFMLCQEDGTWNRDILKCIPDCGRLDDTVIPLIVNGWNQNSENWPWYVALYQKIDENDWSFICGATLISEQVAITAAHCTWNTRRENLKVALGKSFSDVKKTDEHTKFSNLQRVIMHPSYQDRLGNYATDIALLIVESYMGISRYIKPICIDWNLENVDEHLKANSLGTITGMGLTEKNQFSDHLRMVHVPVIDPQRCVKSQKRDLRKYVSYTTFCAGWLNNTGVCNGDSGGGLMFPINPDRWFMQGIVSVSPRKLGTNFCDLNHYTIFTKVAVYVNWIRKELAKLGLDNLQ